MVLRVEPGEAEVPGVGDVDLAYRRCDGSDVVPHAQGREDLARAVAERGAALIEARLQLAASDHGLDQRYLEPGAGQRQRQARPHHAAPDDGDIALLRGRRGHAAAINASIASGSFGASSVRTSQPLRVTTTSSSMRTPMFQKRFDTPRVPAAM